MSPQEDKTLRHVGIAVVLVATAAVMWRAGVLPGLWDLQHIGRDVALEAQRERTLHRAARLAEFESEQTPQGAVLFLGSSTIERMPLERLFPGAQTLNRGIGDEPALDLVERIGVGIKWDRVSAVVLYPASVDFRRLGESRQILLERAALELDAIRERAPEVPVLILGLLSQRDLTLTARATLQGTNADLRALAKRRGYEYVETDRAPLTGKAGRMEVEYSADRLHLNAFGYQVLGRWIRQNGGAVTALLFP